MLLGVGEILGGGIFGLLGKKTNRYGRDPIVVLGYLVHMVSFFLIFINLPTEASLKETTSPAYINSNLGVALLCACKCLVSLMSQFLHMYKKLSSFEILNNYFFILLNFFLFLVMLGFADACYNTQCYSILGTLYSKESAPAFALFKCVQSLAAAIAFFYATHLDLHITILILAITASIGTVSFCAVEWSASKPQSD